MIKSYISAITFTQKKNFIYIYIYIYIIESSISVKTLIFVQIPN